MSVTANLVRGTVEPGITLELAGSAALNAGHRGRDVLAERALAQELYKPGCFESVVGLSLQVCNVDHHSAVLHFVLVDKDKARATSTYQIRLNEFVEDLHRSVHTRISNLSITRGVGHLRSVHSVHISHVENEGVCQVAVGLFGGVVLVEAIQLQPS